MKSAASTSLRVSTSREFASTQRTSRTCRTSALRATFSARDMPFPPSDPKATTMDISIFGWSPPSAGPPAANSLCLSRSLASSEAFVSAECPIDDCVIRLRSESRLTKASMSARKAAESSWNAREPSSTVGSQRYKGHEPSLTARFTSSTAAAPSTVIPFWTITGVYAKTTDGPRKDSASRRALSACDRECSAAVEATKVSP
mmetsp:Transcript_15739/g.40734  ORF Transcript_15739/g.40734 Transcript_15739/m.40734 type:complete len:202 (+) Transcript_15739:2202-2807(+)